jgi:hypothetical protein
MIKNEITNIEMIAKSVIRNDVELDIGVQKISEVLCAKL